MRLYRIAEATHHLSSTSTTGTWPKNTAVSVGVTWLSFRASFFAPLRDKGLNISTGDEYLNGAHRAAFCSDSTLAHRLGW